MEDKISTYSVGHIVGIESKNVQKAFRIVPSV